METNNQNIEQKSNSALVGIIVIVIILILGGIYLVKNKAQEIEQQKQEIEEANKKANDLSESDDLLDIEADLNDNANYDYLEGSLQ